MESVEFVPIRTCRSHEEATIIANSLSDFGIPASLDNDHQAGLTGVLAIRILVPANRLDEAESFLSEHHST